MEEDTLDHVDPDFQPWSRPRSCTWPLHRADISVVDHGEADSEKSTARTPPMENKRELSQLLNKREKACASGGATQRKGSSRRNAWGNQSYADLISQAIENSPEKRLTLAQIYDWIVSTVPYFKDKGDSNSSHGWKNSIRHNLSLHNKFQRVTNESTSMSSWWMLSPEGSKSTKLPRRRAASMDNNSKLLKSRMRAKQKKKQAAGSTPVEGAVDSPGSSQQCEVQRSSSLEAPDAWTGFRTRTGSNASTLSGRVSPTAPGQGDDDQLLDDERLGGYSVGGVPSTLSEALVEELDLIDGLRLLAGQSTGVSPSPAPRPLPEPLYSSTATLPPQVTSFTTFPSLRTPTVPDPPSSQTETESPITRRAGLNSSFGNGLFSPMTGSYSQETNIWAYVPSALEVLLTSDSPPPCDMMMTLTDPLMANHDGAGLLGLGFLMAGGSSGTSHLMLEKNVKPNSVTGATLQPQPLPQSRLGTWAPGLSQDAAWLTTVKTQFTPGPSSQSREPLFGDMVSPADGSTSSKDRLPMDLDLDMFTENLDWDVDSIINSDFMDGEGFDFSFDPLVPTGQEYPGPTTTQASPRSCPVKLALPMQLDPESVRIIKISQNQ
ncbi:hypothetical protein COCON_G00082540 [Conger conger]|uniref:Fork-head domain-containing protein n=1 Tax=Conger conger TaxID=82655 RepID=A0A9Q1I2Q7_CONCO|nr:hypothetical protein COCON_G00082540 [Conger conger]